MRGPSAGEPHRWRPVRVGPGVEHRRHQRVAVVLAPVPQGRAVLPRGLDGPDREDRGRASGRPGTPTSASSSGSRCGDGSGCRRPARTGPCDIDWRSLAVTARSIGLRAKATAMLVSSVIRSVCSAAGTRGRNGRCGPPRRSRCRRPRWPRPRRRARRRRRCEAPGRRRPSSSGHHNPMTEATRRPARPAIERLEATEQIRQLAARYALALDSRDVETLVVAVRPRRDDRRRPRGPRGARRVVRPGAAARTRSRST